MNILADNGINPFVAYGKPDAGGAESFVWIQSDTVAMLLRDKKLSRYGVNYHHHKLLWYDMLGISYSLVTSSLKDGIMVYLPRMEHFHDKRRPNWIYRLLYDVTTYANLECYIPKLDEIINKINATPNKKEAKDLVSFSSLLKSFKSEWGNTKNRYPLFVDIHSNNFLNHNGVWICTDPLASYDDDEEWLQKIAREYV